MYRRFLVFWAKVLIGILRMTGSSGSALPGLMLERLAPNSLAKTLQPVEKQIILVTGTNGKTTTTKMLVSVLRSCDMRVVTNGTGSNMTRGLIAALIDDMTYFGSLKTADWFVFEMDEAYAPIFTQSVSPRAVVGLNVLRDQLDRYGELDTTARLIGRAAQKADVFVYNQVDPLLEKVANDMRGAGAITFGIDSKLRDQVINEQTLHQPGAGVAQGHEADVVLYDSVEKNGALKVAIGKAGKTKHQIALPVLGFHNALNATAVFAVANDVLKLDTGKVVEALEKMPIPFGRGETLKWGGKTVTVALVKNPAGFTSNLQTFVNSAKPDAVLFAVNDKLADGRDVSWLWDVDFVGKIPEKTQIMTSGIRGYDMALRLKQDGYKPEADTSIAGSIAQLLANEDVATICIIPTYTALFEVRAALAKHMEVPKIW